MGAIVSHRKEPRKTRVQHKAVAVNAFKSNEESSQQTNVDSSQKEPVSNNNTNSNNINGKPTNVALSSWGEGIVGTSTHSLQDKGVVSSRGVDYDVVTSKELYPELNKNEEQKENNHSYAIVTSLQPYEAATIIQKHVRGHQARKDLEEQRKAASVIQRHVRGHQARLELKMQQEAAAVIQKKYRKHLESPDRKQLQANDDTNDDEDDDDETSGEDKPQYRKAWKESTPQAPALDKNVQIGEKTRESFNLYQDDITNLKWKTEQQLEMTTMGDDYKPPRILLIASNVPKSDILQKIVGESVLTTYYEFSSTTLDNLLGSYNRALDILYDIKVKNRRATDHDLERLCGQEEVSKHLENYKLNSKARSVGFVCKGGPGYFNPVQGVLFTKKKVEQDENMASFWKTLGTKMSKLDCHDTKIHIIGCNVTGNKRGVKLLKFLSKFMRPSLVKVESPLEVSEAGKEMIGMYFDYSRYRTWKTRMYSKISIDV